MTSTTQSSPATPTLLDGRHPDPTPLTGGAAEQTGSRDLIAAWVRLWSGDHTQADRVIATDFRLHAAMVGGGDGSAVDSPATLVGWIRQSTELIPDLAFTVQVGPLVDDDHIVVRWRAQGHYQGGMPGAQAPAGTPVDFTGTDILRVQEHKIAEYWVNSDTLLLLTQLGVGA